VQKREQIVQKREQRREDSKPRAREGRGVEGVKREKCADGRQQTTTNTKQIKDDR
jgi:hypothetical protein